MIPNSRASTEVLPSWLGGLPEVPPTPVRAYRPPDESVLQRALANPRTPLHIGLVAIALGVGAAMAAGAMRATNAATSHAEMSAFAESKAAELRAFSALRASPTRHGAMQLAPGGSLTTSVPGYSDVVEGTDGRRFYRRWDIDAAPTGSRRIIVRVVPASPRAGRDSLDVTAILPRR
jgi:hypothetical protein